MCKCRAHEKRLVEDEGAEAGVTAVPGCLMGSLMGKKEPDSSQGCAEKISTPYGEQGLRRVVQHWQQCPTQRWVLHP